MLKQKTLRVRAVRGILVRGTGQQKHGAAIGYVGRSYDAKADPSDLEAEFPIGAGSDVPNDAYYRKAVADGDLEAADDATREACGIKSKTAQVVEQPAHAAEES